jgi:hypothetical protein
MTLLSILKKELVGKRIAQHGGGHNGDIRGCIILDVYLDQHEPMFELVLKYPNGRTDNYTYLEDWEIEVE